MDRGAWWAPSCKKPLDMQKTWQKRLSIALHSTTLRHPITLTFFSLTWVKGFYIRIHRAVGEMEGIQCCLIESRSWQVLHKDTPAKRGGWRAVRKALEQLAPAINTILGKCGPLAWRSCETVGTWGKKSPWRIKTVCGGHAPRTGITSQCILLAWIVKRVKKGSYTPVESHWKL